MEVQLNEMRKTMREECDSDIRLLCREGDNERSELAKGVREYSKFI